MGRENGPLASSTKIWYSLGRIKFSDQEGARQRQRFCMKYTENAPEHKSWLVQDYPEEQNIKTLQHHPYVHDVAPSDIFVLPLLKEDEAGGRFSALSAPEIAIF